MQTKYGDTTEPREALCSASTAHRRRNSVTVCPNVTSRRDRATLIQEGKGVAVNAAQRMRESRTLVSAAACDGVRASEVVVGRVHGRRGKRVAQARPPQPAAGNRSFLSRRGCTMSLWQPPLHQQQPSAIASGSKPTLSADTLRGDSTNGRPQTLRPQK